MPNSVRVKFHEKEYSEEFEDELFNQLVEEFEDVEYGPKPIEKSTDPTIVLAGATLVVASIDTLVNIYSELKSQPEVQYVNLWGPDSKKYPVQVYSDAIGRIENPGEYEFYDVDEEITLVVCDSMEDVRKVQADVDTDGIVEELN